MSEIINNLILQFFIVLLCPFLYHSFWKDRFLDQKSKYDDWIIAFFCSLSVILCMIFAIQVSQGHYFDLRIVPLIFTIWYSNLTSSFIVLIVLLTTRTFIGGDGILITLIVTFFIYLISFYLKTKYLTSPLIKKIQIGVLLILFYTFGKIWLTDYFVAGGPSELFSFYFLIIYTCLISISMYVLVYLLETFREKELSSIEQQKAEKRKMVNQLAASVAHEVFSPLTSIKGFVQLYLNSLQTKQPQEVRYLELALNETDRTEAIIKDYLLLANPICNLDEQIHVSNEIKLSIDAISHYAHKHKININFEEVDPVVAIGNTEKIRLVLCKIFNNAIEASTPGSSICCTCYKESNNAVILIRDNGVGMPKEMLDLLGLPFYTLKDKGTGLSLMICYRIMELMKGKLVISSNENVGTDVKIYLPISS